MDISVVVPCYKAAGTIEECLQSIFSQKHDCSIEVIAVDDGSPDETGVLLDRAKELHGNLRVIHQANRGFSGARNAALNLIRGETVAFVDSDDRLEPNAIQLLWDAYRANDCEVVVANYRKMSPDGTVVYPIEGERNHGAPWGRLYAREVWRSLEFPEGLLFEDTVNAFCIDGVYREVVLSESAYLYRLNPAGITQTVNKSKKGIDNYWVTELLLAWRHCLGLPFNQKLYDQVLYQFGPLGYSRANALSGEELRVLFFCMSGLLNSVSDFEGFTCSRDGAWRDIEKALRDSNYPKWRLAVMAVQGR